MSRFSTQSTNGRKIFQGMLLLASGRREGIQNFSGTPDSFGAALAPQLAFLVVGAFQLVFVPDKIMGATKVLLSLCTILLPAVVSQFFAKRWGREALWLRYITAATWSNWIVLLVTLIATLMAAALFPALLQQTGFIKALVVVGAVYELWLQWFIARAGLGLGGVRAAVLYATVLLSTLALYALAAFLPPHYMVLNDLFQPSVSLKTN